MIDLHCHLLPDVDDGPAEIEESVELCRQAAGDGCTAIVATPHQRHPYWWNDDRELLTAKLDQVRERVQAELGDRLRLLAGAEIHVDSMAVVAEIQRLPGGSLFSVAGSRYLLLELSRQEGFGPDPEEVIHELRVAGWRPIVAHPEMYPWLGGNIERVARLVGAGALTQVTAMSVTGAFGPRAEQAARALIDAGLVHFVASDSHGVGRRPPGLSLAFATLRASWGEETARALTHDNPAAVLANRPLEAIVKPLAAAIQ